MGLKENLERIRLLSHQAELGGGEERLKRQREGGRLTARERIDFLLDQGSFVELDKFKTHRCDDFGMAGRKIPGDGVITGYGTIRRPSSLYLFARLHFFLVAVCRARLPKRFAK